MQIIDDLRQRHLEKFDEEYNKFVKQRSGRNIHYGGVVRAAAAAGWFSETVTAVDAMPPAEVRRLAAMVDDAYNAAVGIDPNS